MYIFRTLVAALVAALSASAAHAYNNDEIKDPRKCANLLAFIVKEPGQGMYTLTATENVAGAGRYDAIVIDDDLLADPARRAKLADTQGRLLYRSASSPESASDFFDRWVSAPVVFFAIPYDSAGVKSVFGDGLSKKSAGIVVGQMNKLRAGLADLPIVVTPSKADDFGLKRIIAAMNDADTDTIIVVAHNDKGKLKFPNGEAIDANELQKTANAKGKALLIIACSTLDDAGLDFEGVVSVQRLNFEGIGVGLGLAEKKRSTLTEQTIFMGDLIYYMNQGLDQELRSSDHKVKVIILGTTSTTATVGFIAIQNTEGEK